MDPEIGMSLSARNILYSKPFPNFLRVLTRKPPPRWCVALSVRGGAEYLHFPMGRETVLAPARWEEGEFPVVDQIKGTMEGWPMPEENTSLEGIG